jgi:menaquinone-9 beta-reductase
VTYDLAICGGGPAGLSVAIRAAQAGFSAVVLERSAAPDKACGEGLMPRGVAALARLGILGHIDPARCTAFRGIRYVQEDGRSVEARFADGDGLGIRRTALGEALRNRAAALGVEVRQTTVRGFEDGDATACVRTDSGTVESRAVVAADGLHSAVRHAAGLDLPATDRPRFGIRRHFRMRPWSDVVEVHWAPGVEAYVTPVGAESVNVAFLFQDAARSSFESLLARFPALRERVASAAVESEARGAGPLRQPVRARSAGRLALVGDAAGYVDAITGQGLSLAFLSAERLVEALAADADVPRALRRYDASLRAEWLRYSVPARGLLALSARPKLRSRGLRLCERYPALFGALVRAVG